MKRLYFEETPITRMPYYSKKLGVNLLCKRDDLFQKAGGGSKARMLQYILADINVDNTDVLLTAGGPCSNFNRACALMCSQLGIPMHLIEYTDTPRDFKTSLNYYLCKLAGIRTTRCAKSEVVDVIQKTLDLYKQESLRVKYIYGGGKSLEGISAYFDAVKDLFFKGIEVDHVFVACGTGTTLTGICAGMQEFYPKVRVHAISTARILKDEMPVLLEDMSLLNNFLNKEYSFDNMRFYENYLCGGYSKYTDELFNTIKECISNEGVILDPTYSGKAFWGMNDVLGNSQNYQGKNILFWNTGGIFNLLSENND